jgi:hypothetical protein
MNILVWYEQVYLRPLKTEFKEAQIILVEAERATGLSWLTGSSTLVESAGESQEGFGYVRRQTPVDHYRGNQNTRNIAVFSIFDDPACETNHIYLCPSFSHQPVRKSRDLFVFILPTASMAHTECCGFSAFCSGDYGSPSLRGN